MWPYGKQVHLTQGVGVEVGCLGSRCPWRVSAPEATAARSLEKFRHPWAFPRIQDNVQFPCPSLPTHTDFRVHLISEAILLLPKSQRLLPVLEADPLSLESLPPHSASLPFSHPLQMPSLYSKGNQKGSSDNAEAWSQREAHWGGLQRRQELCSPETLFPGDGGGEDSGDQRWQKSLPERVGKASIKNKWYGSSSALYCCVSLSEPSTLSGALLHIYTVIG